MFQAFTSRVRKVVKKIMRSSGDNSQAPIENRLNSPYSNQEYWTEVNVTGHQTFASREASLEYLHLRNSIYLFYENFVNYNDLNGKVVMDYGCGPGNDLVAFSEFATPKRLVGVDISPSSLKEAGLRLQLHQKPNVELVKIDDSTAKLPFESGSFDVIHSSGVLMCTPNMEEILADFHRLLKPGGVLKLMIYNYDSIWLHYFVAFDRQILNKIDADLPLLEAFRRSTDGEDCPISRCYKPQAFTDIVTKLGFTGGFTEACISTHEMQLLDFRMAAVHDARLAREHRDFLRMLTFDAYGRPCHEGRVAGIDACFHFEKK